MSKECPSCHVDCDAVWQCVDCDRMFCRWCGRWFPVFIADPTCPDCTGLFEGRGEKVSSDEDDERESDVEADDSAIYSSTCDSDDYTSSGGTSSSSDSSGFIFAIFIFVIGILVVAALSSGSNNSRQNTPMPVMSNQRQSQPNIHDMMPLTVGQELPIAATSTQTDVSTGSYANPFEYCKTVVNSDGTLEGGINDSRYAGIEPPTEVTNAMMKALNTKNNPPYAWRCMGGNIYWCSIGASGRGCRNAGKFTIGTTTERQFSAIKQFCTEHPNDDVIANAVNYTAYELRCDGIAPIVTHYFPVDERGYIQDNWIKVEPETSLEIPAETLPGTLEMGKDQNLPQRQAPQELPPPPAQEAVQYEMPPTRSTWTLSRWKTTGQGAWETQPLLTINGQNFTFNAPQEYIARLQELKSRGNNGPLDENIGQFANVVSEFNDTRTRLTYQGDSSRAQQFVVTITNQGCQAADFYIDNQRLATVAPGAHQQLTLFAGTYTTRSCVANSSLCGPANRVTTNVPTNITISRHPNCPPLY